MSYALGIDLGTTFTAAAIADENGSRMVGLSHDRTAIPSVVAPARKLVGEEALVVSATAPWTVAREFKRRFGSPTPIVLEGVGHRRGAHAVIGNGEKTDVIHRVTDLLARLNPGRIVFKGRHLD